MLMYRHEEQRHVDASPERVFAVLSDVAHHDQLAGSREVKAIRVLSEGALHVGSEWEADEEIKMGRKRQKFVAHSTVREWEAPRVFSWTSAPETKPIPRRIQWWYRLTPEDGGTRVVEQVEVDMSPAMNLLMKLPYRFMRGTAVADGMRHTLDNLSAKAASGS
jgi:uncharacterized protein YndB with AHSA1/START domain